MPKYMLVSFKTCPWVQRSAIALREKNSPFEFRHIESDNRPDWFLAISPHKKVPVLTIDDKVTLFESNAINEYLDEMVSPQLHPADPIERAINRAWTDYVPTFASNVTGCAYAKTEADYDAAIAKIPDTFDRIEKALEKQGSGPFFNGARYSLVNFRLCAVSAALCLPRSHQEDRDHGKISAAQGVDRRADEAPVDPLLPGGRVRGDVPRGAAQARQLPVAVRRGPPRRGGIAAF